MHYKLPRKGFQWLVTCRNISYSITAALLNMTRIYGLLTESMWLHTVTNRLYLNDISHKDKDTFNFPDVVQPAADDMHVVSRSLFDAETTNLVFQWSWKGGFYAACQDCRIRLAFVFTMKREPLVSIFLHLFRSEFLTYGLWHSGTQEKCCM